MQKRSRRSLGFMLSFLASLTLCPNLVAQQQQQPPTDRERTNNHLTPSSTKGDLEASEEGHTHFLDFKNGFQGHKFGSTLDQFEGFKLLTDLGREKIYAKEDEHLRLGAAEIDHVHYHFLDGKFRAAELFTKGTDNTSFLLQILQTAFGPGVHPKDELEIFMWRGVVANAHFAEDSSKNGQLWLGNNDLDDQFMKYQRQLAVEAAKQL
jgi:hypothetical protein